MYEQLSNVTPGVQFYKVNVEEQSAIVEEVTIRGVRVFAVHFMSGTDLEDIRFDRCPPLWRTKTDRSSARY